jgi:hypothetical protein
MDKLKDDPYPGKTKPDVMEALSRDALLPLMPFFEKRRKRHTLELEDRN